MKHRHVKSFEEKYSNRSVIKELNDYLFDNRKNFNIDEVFDGAPYIGICYCPVDYWEFMYDFEEIDLEKEGTLFLKVKVVEVCDNFCRVLQKDDHHHNLHLTKRIDCNNYRLYGNEIIKYDQSYSISSIAPI